MVFLNDKKEPAVLFQTRGLVHEFMHGWGPWVWPAIEAYLEGQQAI